MSEHDVLRMRSRLRSEQGFSFIQVGIGIFVLVGFLSFVLDYGVMWLGRVQAQNSADAGALAGAIARAYDEPANPPAVNGITEQSATLAAQTNDILNTTPGVQVSWTCPPFAAGSRCVRVDSHRDGTNTSIPLPTFFARIFGINSQRVRATATAEVLDGNATNCMRPFSVADRWIDRNPPGLNTPRASGPGDDFLRWERMGQNVVQVDPYDLYTPPSQNNPGTGYRLPNDIGTQVVLKAGNNPQSPSGGGITPGWSLPIRLPDGSGGYTSGAADFKDAIGTCIGQPVAIGDYLPLEQGVMVGPTSQGVANLVAQDPNASWDSTTGTIQNSCAPGCAPISPRIIPISVFDMDEFQYRVEAGDWNGSPQYPACPSPPGGRCIHVVNILGFFVEGMNGQDVDGYVMTIPGDFVTGSPSVGGGAAFLVDIQLIQ